VELERERERERDMKANDDIEWTEDWQLLLLFSMVFFQTRER